MSTSAQPLDLHATEHGAGMVWTLVQGAVAGALASLAMAIFAMVAAATYQGSGFFTPLYHIASTFLSPSNMMTSMQQAGSGQTFYFLAGPAIVGALVHMMVGAMYGAIFGLSTRLLHLSGSRLILAGVAYGLVVFAVSAWIALPVAAAVFSSGDQITNMASMAGYPTFIIQHIIFGFTAGLILSRTARPNRTR